MKTYTAYLHHRAGHSIRRVVEATTKREAADLALATQHRADLVIREVVVVVGGPTSGPSRPTTFRV